MSFRLGLGNGLRIWKGGTQLIRRLNVPAYLTSALNWKDKRIPVQLETVALVR